MNSYVFIHLAATDAQSNESWQLCMLLVSYLFFERVLGKNEVNDGFNGGGVWIYPFKISGSQPDCNSSQYVTVGTNLKSQN